MVKGILSRRLVSIPVRDMGGAIADSEEVLIALIKRSIDITRELGCSYLELKKQSGMSDSLIKEINLGSDKSLITSILYLDDMNSVNLWKKLDKKSVRWAIGKAKKSGVTTRWGNSLLDIDDFYKIFRLTRRKLGVPGFPLSFFRALWEELAKNDLMRVCLAQFNGQPIAGAIFFTFKDTIIYAYAGSNKAYLNLRPNNLVLWDAMEWACNNGFRRFDMGEDSPNNKGLVTFKSRWGCEQAAFPNFYFLNKIQNIKKFDPDNSNYKLFRAIWRHMPESLNIFFERFIYKLV